MRDHQEASIVSEETNKLVNVNKRRRRPWLRRLVWIALGLMALALVVIAVQPKPVEVELARATRGVFSVTVDEDGVTRVTDRFIISAPLAGQLERIELDPGAEVKQGDVLARLTPAKAPLLDERTRREAEARVLAASAGLRQAEAQKERAQAALELSTREATTGRALASRGVVNQQELDRLVLDERSRTAELASAEFATKVARHELSMAQAALGRIGGKGDSLEQLVVTSPVSGRVLKVIRESEGVVQAGTELLEVGDPSALEIAVDVLTSDAVHIRPGAHVSVEEWGGDNLIGVVRQIEPSAFTRLSALGVEEQRVNVVIDLKSPYEEWRLLGDGYRTEARIEIYRNESALTIPWNALFRRSEAFHVFVQEQGRAALRKVEVGRRNERVAEILSGLDEGEEIILHPSDRVQPGVLVASQPAR